MREKEIVEFSPTAEREFVALADNTAYEVLFEAEKLARTPLIETERVAVLNDRYDIYVLDPGAAAPVLIVVRDPLERKSLIARITAERIAPRQAAELAAAAAGLPVDDVFLLPI